MCHRVAKSQEYKAINFKINLKGKAYGKSTTNIQNNYRKLSKSLEILLWQQKY